MISVGAAGDTEQRFNVARIAPGDLHRISGIITHKPAADLGAVRVAALAPVAAT
ncbi:MAG: hypothetical protein ACLQLT_14125 [Methylovirgula sp.]